MFERSCRAWNRIWFCDGGDGALLRALPLARRVVELLPWLPWLPTQGPRRAGQIAREHSRVVGPCLSWLTMVSYAGDSRPRSPSSRCVRSGRCKGAVQPLHAACTCPDGDGGGLLGGAVVLVSVARALAAVACNARSRHAWAPRVRLLHASCGERHMWKIRRDGPACADASPDPARAALAPMPHRTRIAAAPSARGPGRRAMHMWYDRQIRKHNQRFARRPRASRSRPTVRRSLQKPRGHHIVQPRVMGGRSKERRTRWPAPTVPHAKYRNSCTGPKPARSLPTPRCTPDIACDCGDDVDAATGRVQLRRRASGTEGRGIYLMVARSRI